MKKFLKIIAVVCILTMLLAMSAMAANSDYSRYGLTNTGQRWQPTYSTNRKATPEAYWFIQVEDIGFGEGNTSGTLGMAHVPTYNSDPRAYIHWTKTTNPYAYYYAWLPGYGAADMFYQLSVRLDDLIYPTTSAYTKGYWNSN